ncbi:MAG: hypothetical protein MR965_12295 [Lachnospiraceae bacterium]|nr:hypothetical protein [Lachnospiraceae bacterium]
MKKRILAMMMVLTLLVSGMAAGQTASAEEITLWAVMGKFTLSQKKIVTNGKLVTYDNETQEQKVMKKKKRTFKVTSATIFGRGEEDHIKEMKNTKATIKEINKKSKIVYIQFKGNKLTTLVYKK